MATCRGISSRDGDPDVGGLTDSSGNVQFCERALRGPKVGGAARAEPQIEEAGGSPTA